MTFLCRKTGEKPFDPLLSWRDCVMLDYLRPCRGGVSLPGSWRPRRPVVHRCPAGLPGNVSSDGHTSPAVGGVLWRLRQLCGRLVGRSDSPVRCSAAFFCSCSPGCVPHNSLSAYWLDQFRVIVPVLLSEDSCCLKATSWLHEKLIFLSIPYQA